MSWRNGQNMKEYELVHEIFNQCSGNQMRDVDIKEIEIEDPRAYVEDFLKSHKTVEIFEDALTPGAVIFDVTADGLHMRFSFTEI